MILRLQSLTVPATPWTSPHRCCGRCRQ